jgi:hypothetical protein
VDNFYGVKIKGNKPGDTKPHVLINFPTKARVIAIKVQGGPDGYIEKFQIGFKETPEEFQYIRDTNNKIVVFSV